MSDDSDYVSESGEFDLAGFIQDRSSLFVVMGVFGALGIYFAQATPTPISKADFGVQLGFHAAYLVALLVLLLIYKEMIGEFESFFDFYDAHVPWRNPALLVFNVLMILLAYAIGSIITPGENVIIATLLVVVYVAGAVSILLTVRIVAKGVPRTLSWRFASMLLVTSSFLVVTHLIFSELEQRYTLQTISELSFSDPEPLLHTAGVLFFGTVRGFAALAILVSIVSVPIVAIEKYLGRSPYDLDDAEQTDDAQ